jgi:metal-responsive CopG/Arc/MetJ family transcriptional regulator
MSRRRSTDPTTAISITLRRSLLEMIDDELTRTSSRSNWIATACQMRLSADTLALTDRQLFAAVHARLTDGVLKNLILEHITSSDHDGTP